MALQGMQFDKMRVSPLMDASIYQEFSGQQPGAYIPNRGGGFLPHAGSGLNVTVDSGEAIVQGHLIVNTASVDVPVPANSTGKIVIVIDLSKANISTGDPSSSSYTVTNNQLSFRAVPDGTTLTQQDIFNNGQVYMSPICTYTTSASTVTAVIKDHDFFLPIPWNVPRLTKQLVQADSIFTRQYKFGSLPIPAGESSYWNHSGLGGVVLLQRKGPFVDLNFALQVGGSGLGQFNGAVLQLPNGYGRADWYYETDIPLMCAYTCSINGWLYLQSSGVLRGTMAANSWPSIYGATMRWPTTDEYPTGSDGDNVSELTAMGMQWPLWA